MLISVASFINNAYTMLISVASNIDNAYQMSISVASEFTLLESLGILGDNEMIDAILDIACHEGLEIVDGVVDAMVGDAALREVVGTDLGTAVACRDKRLATAGNVIDILLVLLIIYI